MPAEWDRDGRADGESIVACDTACLQDVEQLVADPWVEADGRLVEKEDGGIGDERAPDLEPATLPAAVAGNGAVQDVHDVERRRDLADPRRGPVGRDAPKAGVQVEIAPAGEGPVDDRILEDDAGDLPRGDRLFRNVEAGK